MGELAPVVGAILRYQGVVVAGSNNGASAQNPRSGSHVFQLADLCAESSRGLGHSAAPRRGGGA